MSDSSEEEGVSGPASSSKKPSNKDLFGDDSDSSSDDNDAMEVEKKDETVDSNKDETNKADGETKTADPLDDDEDDDDVEFDDGGAVVGLSKPAGKKKSVQFGEETKDASADSRDEGASAAAKVDRRTLVLTATTRPATVSPKDDDNGVQLHYTRLPTNLIGIQPQAFDADTYSAAAEAVEWEATGLPHDIVRWRYQRDKPTGDWVRNVHDQLVRESNTRLVQWEDGSWTLHIGKEAYEVEATDSSSVAKADDAAKNKNNFTFAGLNGYLYKAQSAAVYRSEEKEDDDDDDVKKEQPAGTVLECLGPIQSKLTARPSSLQNEAHKSLTVAVRQKTIKKAKIAEFVTQEDPEQAKQERIKMKAELEKASSAAKKRKAGTGYYASSAAHPRMSRDYLEEDEEDRYFDTTNIKTMKRKQKRGDYDDYDEEEEMDDFGDDIEESSDENDTFHQARPTKKRQQAAAAKVAAKKDAASSSSSDDDEAAAKGKAEESEEESEDDMAMVRKKMASRKKAIQAVLDDDDDSD